MLSPQWLDELRSRVTLSSVVMRTTKLQKAGREWKACCPFHEEKTPSFYVNDEKGFYHCFGCQAHGDVIRWMTDQRGLAFIDAVKELASEAGMEVPAPDPRAAERAEQQAELHDVMAAAQAFFRESLEAPEAARARSYLNSRGFDAHTCERFGFGYAPNTRNAIKKALQQFPEPMLIEAGLLIPAEERDPYDRFRDRLTMPIHDARGRVIAFAARILDAHKKDAPKYINSPDTPLFDKGRTLFNLHRAGPASRKSGRVVVVEGQMDAIALASAGIEEAVAPMGTALTERQIELLWRLSDKPILCFDGDTAGQRAAMRAVQRALPLLVPGRSLQFVTLPAGMDPDDVVKRHGAAYFDSLLEKAFSLAEKIWLSERNATTLTSPDEKALLRARLIEHAFQIKDRELQGLYRRHLLNYYYDEIAPKFPKFSREKTSHGYISKESLSKLSYFVEHGSREILIRAVLAALARRPNLIPQYWERLHEYHPRDAEVQYALDVFFDVAESRLDGVADPAPALLKIAEQTVPFHFPFLQAAASDESVCEYIDQALAILVERPEIEKQLELATKRLDETGSSEAVESQAYWRKRKEDLDRKTREVRYGHIGNAS